MNNHIAKLIFEIDVNNFTTNPKIISMIKRINKLNRKEFIKNRNRNINKFSMILNKINSMEIFSNKINKLDNLNSPLYKMLNEIYHLILIIMIHN
jgi:hypothetical protein